MNNQGTWKCFGNLYVFFNYVLLFGSEGNNIYEPSLVLSVEQKCSDQNVFAVVQITAPPSLGLLTLRDNSEMLTTSSGGEVSGNFFIYTR